jgi:hypothetical protein
VQNADSSSLLDVLDAALQSSSSEKRVAMLWQVAERFRSDADPARIRIVSRAPADFREELRRALDVATEAADRKSSKPRDFHAPASTPKPKQRAIEIGLAKLSRSTALRLLRPWQIRQAGASSAGHDFKSP